MSSDVLADGYAPTVAGSPTLKVVTQYWAIICTLFVSNQRRFEEYKKHMLQTTHTNPYTHRTQISYSWILWAAIADFARGRYYNRMSYDAETQHAYTVLSFTRKVNWEMAYEECRLLGAQWRLPTINSPPEDELLRTFIYNGGKRMEHRGRRCAHQHDAQPGLGRSCGQTVLP